MAAITRRANRWFEPVLAISVRIASTHVLSRGFLCFIKATVVIADSMSRPLAQLAIGLTDKIGGLNAHQAAVSIVPEDSRRAIRCKGAEGAMQHVQFSDSDTE